MGQCYSVTLHIKCKDEEGAANALRNKIARAKEEHILYSLDAFAKRGATTETLEGMIRIFLADWKCNSFRKKAKDGFDHYTNDFSASYGWERVMEEMFEEMYPFLEDGSYIYIEPDSGYDEMRVDNGKLVTEYCSE